MYIHGERYIINIYFYFIFAFYNISRVRYRSFLYLKYY